MLGLYCEAAAKRQKRVQGNRCEKRS
jgi:hypothetical protein